jgi:flavorubredoxin
VKVIVVYDTKYGNTKIVAEKIVEGMREVKGIEPAISDVEGVELERVSDSDAILMGSPNHWGGPVGGIKKLIDKLGELVLKVKWIAVFDTYLGRDFEKAVKKMEKRISEKVLGPKLITPGLSIRVGGMKGPIIEGELPKSKEFGKEIANQLASSTKSLNN